ncbi:butyrophilin subfamily 3 member A2-like isoform X1 [Seriola dumerili]|uniref:butyrophilin subfamily 3 member A2-like isoform X1 n=1 Tax=Seriola dumerili TaxID=41447 RepID=UPI000BBEFC5F|nr:butyrophilin subfamily 3 member A2-like isoform X1 [Seriola dumerili]XP_022621198.1 butyrophilin subfamily 3 member A2-like isoform X1 [Seriola dumerili]
MLHLKGLGAIGALVFHHTLVLVLLTRRCEGESQVIGPSQPIVAAVGDDVVLPCHLEPAVDASSMTVEWTRPDLSPRFVHVWRDGVELENKKHPSYVGRTSVSVNKLKLGDVSLKLSRVKLSDEGTYRCFVPTLNRESTVTLVVGAVSSLIISLMRTENDGVVLQCESKGWYPEPELLWLDGEGKLLSAGRTKTVRGPDDLYTVSSRVTVEKRHSNSFTCRVQQKIINQTREIQIHVPDDIFIAFSRPELYLTIFVAVGFLSILAVFFAVWKWRQNKRKMKNMEDFNEDKTNLDQELEKEEHLKKVKVEVMTIWKNHKNQLENLRKQLESQLEEAVETVTKLESTKNSSGLQFTFIRSFYNGTKALPEEAYQELGKRNAGLEEWLKNFEKQLQTTDEGITRLIAATEQDKAQGNPEGQSSPREEAEEDNETTVLAPKEDYYSEPEIKAQV